MSLEMEPTFEDYDSYLKDFIGDSKQLTLLLDYDGTLAPIAPHPNLTEMAEGTKKALNSIAQCPSIFTSVISGRGVDNAKEKIEINEIVYAGNHGLEILYPNGTRYK
jgi:trehalose-phosphatase